MKYVCIDDGAVNELVSGRGYQSIDFEEGMRLVEGLSGRLKLIIKMDRVIVHQDKEGAFFVTDGPWRSKKFLVIDCEKSGLFTHDIKSSDTLTSFQKLLRFCVKYWSSGVFNKSEKIISGTTKAVVFPLPYSNDDPFRIVLEREPQKERLRKRSLSGHFLLVYKSGRHGADSATEVADESNFRKVVEQLPGVYSAVSKIAHAIPEEPRSKQLAATDLGPQAFARTSPHRPFDEWLKYLTQRQRAFVFAPPETPHRLFGPAGTGKTLALMLRTVRVLRDARRKGQNCRALLITHSEATRHSLQDALSVIDTNAFQQLDPKSEPVSLSVATLASLCADVLRQSISATEFVDRDAQDSKILQELYIEQAITRVRSNDFSSFKPHLSVVFENFFSRQKDADLAPLFQHEISVLIKGRAGDKFEKYRLCPPLKYGLPVQNDADKGLVFAVFSEYQSQLAHANQFDTDDVVISAVGQLDTPIWRRRRVREGYDFIAIDETHLFNINELHIFHHFTTDIGRFPISFTVDQAQAVGDRGWNDIEAFGELFDAGSTEEERTPVSAVFRSSPEIREFCSSILAAGATLFTNFSNTLSGSQSAFTLEDERRTAPVRYMEFPSDSVMVSEAFSLADKLAKETASRNSEVLITTLSDDLYVQLRDSASSANKPVTLLERRGDLLQVSQAAKSGHFVLGHADFVGGLEFNAVVIVGVDKGRVPFEGESPNSDSRNYASYSAHNRLYVAASRARYGLCLLGAKARGASELLRGAARDGLVEGL